MLSVTMNDIPGYEVEAAWRGVRADSPLAERVLADRVDAALTRRRDHRDALRQLRVGSTWTEICAYGTAVRVRPEPPR